MSSTGAQGFSSFYHHIALSPELGNFRRFGSFWAKRVHDETGDLLAYINTLNDELKRFPHLYAGSVLDCPKRVFQERCPRSDTQYDRLYILWEEYEKALMRYAEVLSMSERIMNLPVQDKFNTKTLFHWKLPEFEPLFDEDEFVPTGEQAMTYQDDPDTTDTCAWRAFAQEDFLTNRFLQLIRWCDERILARWRRRFARGAKLDDLPPPSTLHYKRIIRKLDTAICAFASFLLIAAVAVLQAVRPMSIRIVLTGVFGTVFPVCLKTIAGSLTRAEVFAATGAFYAVAAVFISNTNSNCACR